MTNWSRVIAADILRTAAGGGKEGGGRRKKRLYDYPKFIGSLHELVSSLSHALETSERSYSGRATRFLLPLASLQLVRAHRRGVCPVWSRMLPEDYGTPEWRGDSPPDLFLPSALPSSLPGPFFRRLRGHCVIQRIKLGPSGSHEGRHKCIANRARFYERF